MFIKQPKMQDLWVAFPRKTVTHVIFRLPNVYTILYIHINVRFRLRYRKYSFKEKEQNTKDTPYYIGHI